jgi:hypothetical protein
MSSPQVATGIVDKSSRGRLLYARKAYPAKEIKPIAAPVFALLLIYLWSKYDRKNSFFVFSYFF